MKHISLKKQLLFLMLSSLGVLATGCINEDLDECYKLRLKVENIEGEDITESGDVVTTSLYIFDENLNYLETRILDKSFITGRNEIVLDNYTADRKLKIVAWGNVNVLGERQTVSEAQRIEDLKVMLKSQDGLAVMPDSLYYGNQQVQTKAGGVASDTEVVIRPKIGSVTIQTLGLENGLRAKNVENPSECDFYLNRTLSGFDYTGEQIGDSVYYNPDGTWNESKTEWNTPSRQTVCPGEAISVSVSAGGVDLGTAVTDIYGDPIRTVPGKNTAIVLTFDDEGKISASVEVRPWGQVDEDIPLK
ncbi:FimB/Mfa2 family fimbrial subunit [Parabacteroides pacaensis]|uniref:FimB/Mfa2 family fimbrial subunit n=1 Tax=Parabacteroides pacaensis TaxID=2086575 RepID=UPI000D112D94|nr:FimB/Mfa2 family fimbrial subunit [Parabacteroides pacaensis]